MSIPRARRGTPWICALLVAGALTLLAPALAAAAPISTLDLQTYPTNMAPGGTGTVIAVVGNAGDEGTTAPITVTISLPEGVHATSIDQFYWSCLGTQTVTCVSKAGAPAQLPGPSRYSGPGDVTIGVAVDPDAAGTKIARAVVAGGGFVAERSVARSLTISDTPAPFGAQPGSFAAQVRRADGELETQAGAHPFEASSRFLLATKLNQNGEIVTSSNLRDINVDLPVGFVGNPQAAAQCPADGISTVTPTCPVASQVGIVNVALQLGGAIVNATVPLYNMKAADGETAAFGFNANVPIHLSAKLRSDGDYGITVTVKRLTALAKLVGTDVIFWGDPADPRHDVYRYNSGVGGYGVPTNALRRPFLDNPTDCTAGPLTTGLRLNSYERPDEEKAYSSTTPTGVTGCEKLDFAPAFSAVPSTSRPDAPSGLDVDLGFRQAPAAGTLAAPPLRNARVTLPEGTTISPSSADGLEACTDAQAGFKTDAPVACPAASKIGTATATTPLLAEPLEGSIYLGSQQSDDPASGDMFRVILALRNELRGVTVRLPGHIAADPQTGRLVTTFDDNPQLPVTALSLRFKDGPRAPLATSPTCGPQRVVAELTPWSSRDAVTRTSDFSIDCAGVGGFAPTFEAGAVSPTAGGSSPFALRIGRPDATQVLDGLSLTLAPGLTARIKGVARCADADAAAGTCAAASRVGTATVGSGPGSSPFLLRNQPVYLTEGYKGGQFGLVAVVRALAGPFDLGTVVVRQAIHIDPIDAHVTVVSDPLPTILKGVPIRLRSLAVDVDRPGFMLNPTSCAARSIGGALHSPTGATAAVSVRFQVGGCASLSLKPSLALTLSGKGQTVDGKHPAVSAALTQPAGQANLKKVRVALPLSLALDTDNANGLCEFADGSKAAPTCPKNSIVGTATAVTPILDQPLSGPVYFVKNVRKDPKSGRDIRTLPKLVIPLAGQNGVKLTLTGSSTVVDDQLVTTFDNIPDAPVSSFRLNINGGKGGILVVSGEKADICKSTQVADQQIDGQNAKSADASVSIQTPSCPLKVISKKVGRTSVALKVGGLGAGKVTVTGKGIKKTTKIITKSTVATITATRTKGTPGKVTVSFDPAGTAKARKATK